MFARFRKAAEPSEIEVSHAGSRYAVGIRRRRDARRITLRVAGPERITLTLPEHTPLAVAERFALAHGGWIAARLARLPERVRLEPGATVPIRGVPHRIVHGKTAREPTRACIDPEGSPVLVVGGDEAGVPGRARRHLIAEAQRDLDAAARRHAAALGATIARVVIRDTRSRWGSCSSSGTLSFSWRLILAPPFVLDYLAAHEVAHLKELNHSHRYWTLLRGLCPATDEAERWLKRNGAGLHGFA